MKTFYLDAVATSNNCSEEHSPDQQEVFITIFKKIVVNNNNWVELFINFQCVVEVGSPNILMETRESEKVIEEICSPSSSEITPIGGLTEEIGSLEVAFLYDAPMREMTVSKLFSL